MKLTLPELSIPLLKIIPQQGPIPAFSAIYRSKPYFITVVVWKDFGVKFPRYGIPVPLGAREGRLVPGPHLSSFFFQTGGSAYLLTGNVMPEDLVEAARKF